jgi:hypothetical protein
MDFNQLLSRMQELDSPALEADTTECGMNMPAPPAKPDTPEPSMTVNVNAQGMDNIESMLSLMAKISGAGNADMPSMAPMPAIMPLDKMMGPAPDMDADNDDKVGGEMDMDKDDEPSVVIKGLDKDGDDEKEGMAAAMDGIDEKDPDAEDKMKPGMANAMDDEEGNEDDDENIKDDIAALLQLAGEKLEAYANEPSEKMRGTDYMNNKIAGGMNRPKGTHPKVADADNPMQKVKEGDDLRTRIHNELTAKLEQFMGAK